MSDSFPRLPETDRLRLRRFTERDLDSLHTMLSDPEVMRYYPAPLSEEESKAWLRSVFRDYSETGCGWWALEEIRSGAFIGQAGVIMQPRMGWHRPLLGYMLMKEYWGLSYAAEAAQAILDHSLRARGIQRVDCLIRQVNKASQRVAEKLGLSKGPRVMYAGYEHDLYYNAPWKADPPRG